MQHSRMIPWCLSLLVLFIPLPLLLAEEILPDFVPSPGKSVLHSEDIREASGIAASCRGDGFLWIINDSGAAPSIHLVEVSGKDRGKINLNQARNIDWEDLVSFSLDGKPYLLVADTGDNNAKRESCTLYVLREPPLPPAGKNLAKFTTCEWRIDFQYEGGPKDCESVAVDTQQKRIILLTKRTDPPEVHELPLLPPAKRGLVSTRKIGETRVSAPADSLIPFRDEPTGLDITPDHSLAAVVTYYGVFLFPRKPGESWADAFSRKPASPAPHLLAQAESVAFSKDGKSIFVVSEGKGSKIVRYQKKDRE